MAHYYSANVTPQVNPSDAEQANLSPAERQAQSESLKTPGVVRVQGDTVTIQQPASAPSAPSVAEKAANWQTFASREDGSRVDLNDPNLNPRNTYITMPDGDKMPLAALLAARLITRDANGRYVAAWETNVNPNQPAPANSDKPAPGDQQDKSQQTSAEDRVPPIQGDNTLGEVALVTGDATVYSLIEGNALGNDLSPQRASSIAQAMGIEPGLVQQMHEALVSEYSEVGSRALEAVGVPADRIAEAVEWMRQQHKGSLVEAFQDIVSQKARSTTKLKALGRDYMSKTGGQFSDAELETFALPEGATWSRGLRGELILNVGGKVFNAQAAMRSGMLKA
jgi:hypothetical protein